MNTGMYAARESLTVQELLHLTELVRAEERLAWLFAQGAAACEQPQLRSFFAHQADRGGERLEELSSLLSTYAGSGR